MPRKKTKTKKKENRTSRKKKIGDLSRVSSGWNTGRKLHRSGLEFLYNFFFAVVREGKKGVGVIGFFCNDIVSCLYYVLLQPVMIGVSGGWYVV